METAINKQDTLDAFHSSGKLNKAKSADYSSDGKLHTEKTNRSGSSIIHKEPLKTINVSHASQSQADDENTGSKKKELSNTVSSHGEKTISKSNLNMLNNRKINSSDLKYVTNEMANKTRETVLNNSDDLGVQTANASVTVAKATATVAKVYSDNAYNVAKGVAKTTLSVGKQVGLTGLCIGGSVAVMATKGNILSKDLQGAWNHSIRNSSNKITEAGKTFKFLADDGHIPIKLRLSETEISKSVAKCANSTISAVKAGYNGTKAVASTTKTIVTGVGKTAVTIGCAYNIVKATNTFPLSKSAFETLKVSAVATGLTQHKMYTAISGAKQSVINTAKNFGKDVVNTVKTSVQITKKGVATVGMTLNMVQGVATGTIPLGVAFKSIRTGVVKGVSITAKGGWSLAKFVMPYAGGFVKFGAKTAFRATKAGLPVLGKTNLFIANALTGTDDMALQAVGATLQTADVAVRLSRGTIKTSLQVGKGVGKVGLKTAKGVGSGAKAVERGIKGTWEAYKKSHSLMEMLKYAGKNGGKAVGAGLKVAFKKAGGSVVNMLLNFAKTAGKKVVVPLIIIVAVFMGGESIIAVPATVAGSLFSGVFGTRDDNTDVETEFEVSTYLQTNVPTYSNATRNEIAQNMFNDLKANGGGYDLVRLKEVGGTTGLTEPTYNGVASIFYTDTEIVDILQPIFNAKMVVDYDLSPKDSEAKKVLKDLYNAMFEVDVIETTEWCGQALDTGDGSPLGVCPDVGFIHALPDCPNMITGTHSSQTDRHCCTTYYTCKGHRGDCGCGASEHTHNSSCYDDKGNRTCGRNEHTHSDSCYEWTWHCNNMSVNGQGGMGSPCDNCDTHFYCAGYQYCNGHRVHTYDLNLDGIYGVLKKEIYDPISNLENIASTRTLSENEQTKLSNLYDAKEIYEVMAQDVFNGSYGGGLSKESLNSVHWHDNGRTGNNDVVNLAIGQCGSVGGNTLHGQTYWSYMGLTKRVSWSGCFVHWCMCNSSASSAWSNPQNISSPSKLEKKFTLSSDIQNAGAGDVIFLDWDCNNSADRMGIVIGTDNQYIYTVEGDVGDEVKMMKYELTASVIKGILYMNY